MAKGTRPKASLDCERIDVTGVLSRADIMHAALLLATGLLASPPVTMVAMGLLLEVAVKAQRATGARTSGLVTDRDTKVDKLWTAMKTLKTWVQGLCDALDPVSALALIEAAGLVVADSTRAAKPLLSATYVPATGIVRLVAHKALLIGKRTSKKTTFTWSWSSNEGKSWSSKTTGYAHADIPDLPPGSYVFHVFASVGDVPGEPTASVPLTIH